MKTIAKELLVGVAAVAVLWCTVFGVMIFYGSFTWSHLSPFDGRIEEASYQEFYIFLYVVALLSSAALYLLNLPFKHRLRGQSMAVLIGVSNAVGNAVILTSVRNPNIEYGHLALLFYIIMYIISRVRGGKNTEAAA